MSKYVHPELPKNVGDFKLMSRQVVDILCQMKERQRFVRGMVCWVGFKQTAVEFDRPVREEGNTKFSTPKMVSFALDAIFSFSSKPLKLGTVAGSLVLFFGASYSAYILFRYFFLDIAPTPGWTTLTVLICLIGGTILFCLGLLGEYIGRIFEEIKGRPLYIVRENVNFTQGTNVEAKPNTPINVGKQNKLPSYWDSSEVEFDEV